MAHLLLDLTPSKCHYGVSCLGSGGSTCSKKAKPSPWFGWVNRYVYLTSWPDYHSREINQGMRQSSECSGTVSAPGLEHRRNAEAQSEEWMSKMTAVQPSKEFPPVVRTARRWRELSSLWLLQLEDLLSLDAPRRSNQFVVRSFQTQWSLRSATRLSSLPTLQLPAELPQKWAQCVCQVFTITDSLSLAPWPLKLVLVKSHRISGWSTTVA